MFYAVFKLSKDTTLAIGSAQLRTLVRDESATAAITDADSGSSFVPVFKGYVSVFAGENVSVAVTSLQPGAEYRTVIVAEDTPGGPDGPNLQTGVSVQHVNTVGLTPSALQINVAEGGDAVNYAILLTGVGEGELNLSLPSTLLLSHPATRETIKHLSKSTFLHLSFSCLSITQMKTPNHRRGGR